MRTALYFAAYLVLLQFGLGRLIPERLVYDYRVDYDVVHIDEANGLRRAIDQIAREVRRDRPDDYVLLLGDSVMYSGPGGPEQSIGYYLQQWSRQAGHPLRVYNLAQPAMQAGDIYATLLMIQEQGISLKRVVVDVNYSGFVARTADQPIATWLGDELHRLDPEAWAVAAANLVKRKTPPLVRLRNQALQPLALWRNRDILRALLYRRLNLSLGGEVHDLRPWSEKAAWLQVLMQDPVYARYVDPAPMDLGPGNLQIYMLQRLIARLKGAQVLFFMAPANQALLAKGVANAGYQANLQQIDAWFAAQPVAYVDWEHAMDDDLFTDHLHLLPAGYERLAAMVGARLLEAPAR